MALAEERLQNFLERAAAAKNAGFHGAHAHFQNFGHFFVAQAFQIAQDDRAAKDVRDLLQGALDDYLNFLRRKLIEGSSAQILYIDLGKSFFRLRINRDVLLQVALEPAAVIQCFANGDAVQPGLQGAALTEMANTLECLQENFLGGIGGIRSVAEHAEDQIENGTVVVSDQPVEGRFRTGLQLGDKVGFISAPREGTGPIGHDVPFFALAETGGGEPAYSGWEGIPTSVRSEY